MSEREEVSPSDPGPVRARLFGAAGWRKPVHRDGMALVLSSAMTSGIGLLYWVVAARLFTPEAVGVNAVALSTMMLLGGAAHLNMTYALLRFVPVAGRAAPRLVLLGYLISAGVAALVGAIFAVGAQMWAPQLVDAVGHGQLIGFFVLATPLWSIFVMQDYVLTAIGRATAVPAANLAFSLLKIVLLVGAAALVLPGGIAMSWVAAVAVVVVAVNLWLLLRALPAHARATQDRAVPITLGAVARFVRADYAGAVFWQAAMFGMPVLVLARLGAAEAAAYGVVWAIAQSLYLISSGMGQSMVAHSAAASRGLEAARRAMVEKALTLVVPVVAVIVLGAPLLLSVFGAHYAEVGTAALVLTALSAIPNVITAATVSAARVRQRMAVLFGLPAGLALTVIILSWLLMPYLGIAAVGLAWLVGQVAVAAGILVATARWLPHLLRTRIDGVRGAVLLRRVGPTAVLSATGNDAWELHERLRGGSESVIATVGPVDGPGALLKVSGTARGKDGLRRQTEVLAALHTDDRVAHWTSLAPRVLGEGEVGDSYYVVESRMSGEVGTIAMSDPMRHRAFVSSAVATITELHRCTASEVLVGDDELHRWVHGPMAVVTTSLPRNLHGNARRLADELDRRIRGCRLPVGWIHGDYVPVNVLTGPDGRITAVVDWCAATADGLPVLDVVVFLLSVRVRCGGVELGQVVLDWLAQSPPRDVDLLGRAQRMLGGNVSDVRVLILLGWLQDVSQMMTKSEQFAAHPVWTRRNVRAVIRGALDLLDVETSAALLVPSPRVGRDGAGARAR